MPEPDPTSPAERWLDAIDSDALTEKDERIDELREDLVEIEVRLARDIAAHPSISQTPMEVLDVVEHDGDKLVASFRELYLDKLPRTS